MKGHIICLQQDDVFSADQQSLEMIISEDFLLDCMIIIIVTEYCK